MFLRAEPLRKSSSATPAPARTAAAVPRFVESPVVQRLRAISRALNARPDAVAQRAMGEQLSAAPVAERAPVNRTGLPDALKSGVEALSGISMDDVRVHRNSGKPAQLQAHAYAQGTEIHVAPGQERHLPHEAWHVVQQKQGRVQPTMQIEAGVRVNDEAGLESEADAMGAQAATARRSGSERHAVVQPRENKQFHATYINSLGIVSPGPPVIQAMLAEWEISDLKAAAGALKKELTLGGSSDMVDRMIDNGNNVDFSYGELMELVNGLFRWAKFGDTKTFAEIAIAKLANPKTETEYEETYAEVQNALERGADAGFEVDGVSRPGVVIPNAVRTDSKPAKKNPKPGKDAKKESKEEKVYDLGGGIKVSIGPVEEADALYHGRDGHIHLEEVKNTPQAFFEKLVDRPGQFERMVEWRNNAPKRVATVRIRTNKGFAALDANERYAGLRMKITDLLLKGLEILVADRPIKELLDG